MKRILRWIFRWLELDPYDDIEWLVRSATDLVYEADLKWDLRSGEFQRHKVYAKMLKRHPRIPRFQIGLAIEIAVYRLHKWL